MYIFHILLVDLIASVNCINENNLVQSSFRRSRESSLLKQESMDAKVDSKNIPVGYIYDGINKKVTLINGTHTCITAYNDNEVDYRYKVSEILN